jgi:Flp pilus assembly protein CpaB
MARTAPPPLERAPGRPRPPETPTPAMVSSGGRQRRWSLALLAVLLTLGSGLAFVVLWLNAGDRKPVLAVARDVPEGQMIQRDDLTVVRVSADPGIDPVPASRRDEVLGQRANTTLLAGMLLTEGAVGGEGGVDTGMAVIAVPIAIEKLPSPAQLDAGDTVLVYETGGTAGGGGGDEAAGTILAEARVLAVEYHDATASLSLTVDQAQASPIAAAAQADRIYLALTGDR